MKDHTTKQMTVHEVSKLSGVSIRTLHYYDEIGLLSPSDKTEAGYRMYDDTSLARLTDILFFRELEFPLKEIKDIIDNPSYSRDKALENQIHLLELKKDHLEGLISYAKSIRNKGEKDMNFDAFDKSKIEAYQNLAKEIWGNTDAYKEYEKKSAEKDEVQKTKDAENLMDIFYQFGDRKKEDPAGENAQALVKTLQDFITKNYYTCTKEILSSLAVMYTAGDDMTKNIDAAGGKGCADFVAKAIEVYCKKP